MDNSILKVNVNPVSVAACSINLEIEVPAEEVKTTYAAIEKTVAAKAALPGFRAGKLPRAILLRNFGKRIEAEAMDKLIQDGYRAALSQNKLESEVISSPELKSSDEAIADNAPYKFCVAIEIKPKFDLPEYKNLQLSRKAFEITDKIVDAELDGMRQRSAKFDKIEGPAEENDYVVCSYKAAIPEGMEVEEKDKHFFESETAWIPLNEPERFPGIKNILMGVKKGDERTAEIAFPEDYSAEPLKGKTLSFTFKVSDLHRRTLPELNDDFAKSLNQDNVEKLREFVKMNIEEQVKSFQKNEMAEQIIDLLLKQVSFELPAKQLENVKVNILRYKIEMEKRNGVEKDALTEKMPELEKAAAEEAANTLRRNYTMSAIIEKEDIKMDEKDSRSMFAYFLNQEKDSNKSFDKIYKEKMNNGEIEQYVSNTLMSKAIDKIISYAEIADVKDENKTEEKAEDNK